MNIVDVVIVMLVVVSAIAGLMSGVVRCIFSLIGLIAGIAFASRNYERFALQWSLGIHSVMLLEAAWFCLLAVFIMVLAALLGWVIRNAVEFVGLAWLDGILGLVFGLLRGAVLVTLCIVTLLVFYPKRDWLAGSALAKYFFVPTQLATQVTAQGLKQRILEGLHVLERDTHQLMNTK